MTDAEGEAWRAVAVMLLIVVGLVAIERVWHIRPSTPEESGQTRGYARP